MKLVISVTNYIFNGKLKAVSRFSIIGILNTLMDFAIFTIFQSLFGINYTVSQIAGFSFGVINSFIFNKNWTFQNRNANKKTVHEFLQFITINLISLIITIIFMRFLINKFELNVYVTKIIVTFIAQITNFLAYKLWVFN
ncbi:MAG: GtrA family protein [Clostridium sp.]|uniref:GtrA family protein n=1 Tax=Clostridium sp. TaxID=1506 RepID=UPI0025C22C7D|nr:GtrA family protein [Clostridium sp.]MCE5222087.1 GtrA family protein [Clostridium sp.]